MVVRVSSLQDAFFGKELMDKSKQGRRSGFEPMGLTEEASGLRVETKHPAARFLDPSSDPLLSSASATPISRTGGVLRKYTSLTPSVFSPSLSPCL